MEHIGVRELRTALAAALRRAAAGERIVVTVDGRPVAQLGPLEPTTRPGLDDLVATGLVTPPARPGAPPPTVEVLDPPVDVRIDRVLDELRGRG